MLATTTIQTALLEALTALNLFREVAPYPLARLTEETFPSDLLKLTLPAALLTFVDDREHGRPVERRINWLLLLIADGTHADAATFIFTAVDAVRENVIAQTLADTIFVWPENRVNALDSSENYTAAALNLTTVEHA